MALKVAKVARVRKSHESRAKVARSKSREKVGKSLEGESRYKNKKRHPKVGAA